MKARRIGIYALVLATAMGTVSIASAAKVPGWVRYYYGEDHTQVVGARGTDCYGEPVAWGVVTDDSTLVYTCID
jgi:hypothetical protein